VTARHTFRFPGPDIKLPPLDMLPMGARLRATGSEGRFLALADGGYVFADHGAAIGWQIADPVDLALSLVGTPYLWGGRTPLGIDCSGLVQLCLGLAGVTVPRDSDMQRGEIGVKLGDGDGPPRRGDVVCFPGHVAFMLDETRVVHATAITLSVGVEPLAAVALRADPTRGQGVLAVRRIASLPT
jgi:cell wall-associated NlpC family hydrolase